MNKILAIILFLLMISIDMKRGVKLFISLILNFLILIVVFYLIACGFSPIIVSLIGCLVMSMVILYYVNKKSLKTTASFKSILFVILILIIFTHISTKWTQIAGFGEEAYEEINMYSYDVAIDFTDIAVSCILIGLIGAATDASVAISSALYEVYENNKHLSKKELFKSGMNIGRDILGTNTNTLLFAFIGEFMTLLLWFHQREYSFLDVINSKTFCSEFVRIMFTGIATLLIIPITSYVTTLNICKENDSNGRINT